MELEANKCRLKLALVFPISPAVRSKNSSAVHNTK